MLSARALRRSGRQHQHEDGCQMAPACFGLQCAQASDGPLLREKVIDVPGRFSKSALSLQVRAGRGNSITLGIENSDVITIVVRQVKYKLVTVIPMGAVGHVDRLNETWIKHRMVPPSNYLIPQRCSPLPTRQSNKPLSQCGNWRRRSDAVGQIAYRG